MKIFSHVQAISEFKNVWSYEKIMCNDRILHQTEENALKFLLFDAKSDHCMRFQFHEIRHFFNSKVACTREKIFNQWHYHCIISNVSISMKLCTWIEETSWNLVLLLSPCSASGSWVTEFFWELIEHTVYVWIYKYINIRDL